MERAARNHLIQGTNADILKRALTLLYGSLPEGVHLLLCVHDEIVLECPEEQLEEAGYSPEAVGGSLFKICIMIPSSVSKCLVCSAWIISSVSKRVSDLSPILISCSSSSE